MTAFDSLRGLLGLQKKAAPGASDGALAARVGAVKNATGMHQERLRGSGHLMRDIDRVSRAWKDSPHPPGKAQAIARSDPDTPETLAAAVEHLDAEVSFAQARLETLKAEDFPCIALLADGASLLISGRDGEHYHVDNDGAAGRVPHENLESRQSGTVFFVRPKPLSNTAAGSSSRFANITSGRSIFESVARFIWTERRALVLQLIAASVLSYAFLLALPLFTMAVYDRVVPHQAMETLWALSIGVILALALDFQLRFVRLKLSDALGAAAYLALQARFFRRILNAEMASAPRLPGPIAHQVRDIEQVCALVPGLLSAIIVDIPFFFVLMLVLYMIGGAVVAAPLVGIIALAGLHVLGHARTGSAIEKSVDVSQKQSNQVFETVAALESAKAATAQMHLLRRWERLSDEAGYYNHRARLWSGFASQSTLIVVQGVIVLVLIIGVYQIGNGAMTVGALAASSLLVGRMVAPIGNLISQTDRALQLMKGLDGLARVLSMPQEKAGDSSRTSAVIKGGISLSNVSFSYPGASTPALDGLSLKIEPGERIGVIGKVGSGKSTMLRLVPRLHSAGSGHVLIDGQDIRQFPPDLLRMTCGFMRQDTVLFDDTLYNNVCFGLDHVPENRFERAADIAGVAALAARLPNGYSTPVGPRGENLSGGERQMVALARALVTDPAMLVLDEPTSSMDNALEQTVLSRLADDLDGRTLIVATHRAPVLSLVDRLVMMDRGRIVADGPKQDVLAQLNGGKAA